jgi:hypothetical protein
MPLGDTGGQVLHFVNMKFIPFWIVVISLAACVPGHCQPPKTRFPGGSAAALAIRNNCYSLLYQLLEEQKDVSILRFIKPEHSDVKNLVKKIAANSAAGAALLEEFARKDHSVKLNDIQLPPGEVSTRDAIASTKEKELLSQTGDTFALTLLLTQAEALSYAWHLAEVAEENEPQPARAHALADLSEDMQNLSKTELSATNSTSIPVAPTSINTAPASRILMIDPSSMPVAGGQATLTIGALQRVGGVYSGAYTINVSPYFFKNEKGLLTILVPDESLASINQGKITAIVGTATTSGKGGKSRHIDATATPADINRGMLKLWFMSGSRKMIFEPAYHFAGNETAAGLAPTPNPNVVFYKTNH